LALVAQERLPLLAELLAAIPYLALSPAQAAVVAVLIPILQLLA